MTRDLQLLLVSTTKVRTGPSFTVEGDTLDEMRANARALVVGRGYRLRSLSFTPTGLIAYVADTESP